MATSKSKKSDKKKSPGKKKAKMSQGMRVLLASVLLGLIVIVCVGVLFVLREKFSHNDEVSFVYEENVEHITPKPAAMTYADIHQLLDNQLINGPDSMGWKRLDPRNRIEVRKIFGAFPSQPYLAELARHIEQTGAPAQLKVSREKGVIHLYWQGQLRFELLYEVPEVAVEPEVRGPRISLIMDDMGGSMTAIRSLVNYGIPITPAILPGISNAKATANFLRQQNLEYMIHIPMEPKSYPRVSPGENALLVSLSEEEIRERVRSYIRELPDAVGGNNHMGSRFTETEDAMRIVLEELKAHQFFFIDSRTISDSVAFSEARKMGLKTATRNIFLDNTVDVSYIRGQIHKMIKLAGEDREIVAICHPHRETFEALRLELDWLMQQPVTFVFASEVVHSY